MDSLEIQVDVSEAYINRVQPNQKVEAVLNAYPDWRIPASVIAIVPTADRSKATVKVRIALDVKDPRIVPEMGVRVAFLESKTGQCRCAGASPGRPGARRSHSAGWRQGHRVSRQGRPRGAACGLAGRNARREPASPVRRVLGRFGHPEAPPNLKDGDAS
jgi:hypothetical protein